MKKYEYMVIYQHKTIDGFGSGRIFVTTDGMIETEDDIVMLDKEIKKINQHCTELFVSGFQLLRKFKA